jgi:uncharacterized protein (DUF488 family)
LTLGDTPAQSLSLILTGISWQKNSAKDIGYAHIEKLGGRRKKDNKVLAAYDNSGWQNQSFRSYADYMVTASFKEGIKDLLLLMAKCDGDLAIMCSEAVPWRCHRRLIAYYLVMAEGILFTTL